MTEPLRGLHLIDPPPAGLLRLRSAIDEREQEGIWLPWLPLAASVVLACVVLVPRPHDNELAARIVGDVLAQEPEPWTSLPSGTEGVRVLLARPSPRLPEQPLPLPESGELQPTQ